MKILLLAPQPFYVDRGTPIAVDMLIRELSAQGHIVDVLTFPGGEDRHYANVSIQRVRGSTSKPVGPGISLQKLWLDFCMLVRAWKMTRRGQYDLAHAVEEAGFIAWLLKKCFGLPYVYDMDSVLSDQVCAAKPWLSPLQGVMHWLESLVIKQASAVAPMCEDVSHFARRYRNRDIHLLRDVALFDAIPERVSENLRESLEVPGEMLLYVGNLETYQGIDLLLESCAYAFRKQSTATLVLIGGSEEHIAHYRRRAQQLEIATRVRFAGPRPVSQLSEYLIQADVLVSARTQGTNTPMKIYSYLYSGTPVLATRLPTHTQVLNDQNAFLAGATSQAFGESMVAALADEALRQNIGWQAMQYAEHNHSQASFSHAVNELYSAIGARLGFEIGDGRAEEATLRSQLVVVGGGVTGTSIALLAARQGYSVTLLEQHDFGAGTSANSLRTIHGGLRYLQAGDVMRSRMSARQQLSWLDQYPYLIKPLAFMLRTGPGWMQHGLIYRLGLWLYHRVIRFGIVVPAGLPADYGVTDAKSFKSGEALGGEIAHWYEAQMVHPERGVLAQVMSARKLGAVCLNYQRVESVSTATRKSLNVRVCDIADDRRWSIQCDWLVDATAGGFDITGLPGGSAGMTPAVDWVKGVNLVLERADDSRAAWGVDLPEAGRKLFICPWQDRLVAGTWYFEQGKEAGLSLSKTELAACIDDLNGPDGIKADVNEIGHIELGLLPAVHGDAPAHERLLNHPVVHQSRELPGLVRVVAVKYTTAGDIAERVLDKITDAPERQARANAIAYGGVFLDSSYQAYLDFKTQIVATYAAVAETQDIERLVGLYGSNAEQILARFIEEPDKAAYLPGSPLSLAEVDYVLEQEMVKNLSDIVIRRTAVGAARLPDQLMLESLMDYLVRVHHWDDDDREAQINQVFAWYQRIRE